MKNHKHIAIPGGHVTWTGNELPTEEVMSSILSLVEAAKKKVSKGPATPKYSPPAWRGKPKFINQNKYDHDYQPVELDSKQLANHFRNVYSEVCTICGKKRSLFD